MNGLCNFLESICIGSPVNNLLGGKRELSDILRKKPDSNNEDERTTNIKRSKVV